MAAQKKSENSGFCVFFILLTELSISFFAMNLATLNNSAPAIRVFINDSHTIRYGEPMADETVTLVLTLAQSMLMWGSVAGALMVRQILNLSRKRSMLLIHVINVVSAVLMGPTANFAASYEALIIGRFLAGIARGLGFAIPAVVAAETSCRQRLGLFQSPYAMGASISLTLAATLGLNKVLGTPELWYWIVTIPALSSVVYFICCPWLPETPVLLLRQGRYDQAKKTLGRLRVTDCNLEAELHILQQEIDLDPGRKPLPVATILKNPELRLQFLTAAIIVNSHGFAGIQGILLYSDFLLRQAGLDGEVASYATIGIYLQAIFAYSLYLLLEKRFGTKKIFLIGASISTASLVIFTISNAIQHLAPWISYVALAALCTTIFANRFGPQVTMHGLMAELTTAASRPTIAFCAGGLFWMNAAITAFVLPYSVAAWNAYAYIPFVVLSVGVVIFTAYMVPATHNRTTAQIQQSFKKRSSRSSRSDKVSDPRNDVYHDNNAYAAE